MSNLDAELTHLQAEINAICNKVAAAHEVSKDLYLSDEEIERSEMSNTGGYYIFPHWGPSPKQTPDYDLDPAMDRSPTPIIPPPLTDAEKEDRPTLAGDFCDCAWKRNYYGGEHHCAKCGNTDPHEVRKHTIELLEEAGTWAANNGNLALSSELFDTASLLKRGIRL